MDKRKLRLILLAIAGIFILVVGIRAAMIYTRPLSYAGWWDFYAETCFGKNAESLTSEEEDYISETFWFESLVPLQEQVEFAQRLDVERRNAEFTAWLLRWIVKPVVLFSILVAALVVSRVILNRIRPPSSPTSPN